MVWVFMGYNPQESLENTVNTMGTLLGVHPNCPLKTMAVNDTFPLDLPPCRSGCSHYHCRSAEVPKGGGWNLVGYMNG